MIESWHPLLRLLVVTLAVARVTLFLVDDTVLDIPRGRLRAKVPAGSLLDRLFECQRCTGFWVALVGTVGWFIWPIVVTFLATPWAVAMLAWWFGGSWLDDEEDE
jgi:hypothetical protein